MDRADLAAARAAVAGGRRQGGVAGKRGEAVRRGTRTKGVVVRCRRGARGVSEEKTGGVRTTRDDVLRQAPGRSVTLRALADAPAPVEPARGNNQSHLPP